jgi:hypothetical protein
MQRQTITAVCITLLLGCAETTRIPAHSDFKIGASREQVLREYGEPRQITEFHKTGNQIWGAIETFWLKVPMGSSVEVWSYPSQQSIGHGDTELYFIDDSAMVNGVGFSPKGVIYESNGGT